MYYYKYQQSLICLKEPYEELPDGYEEITQEEYEQELANRNSTQPVGFAIRTQISSLKQQLAATDYQAIKYAEGWISEQDYAPIKAQRQAIRDQINQLEESL